MNIDSLLLMRFEWITIVLIFVLLSMKLQDADKKPKSTLVAINILLLLNFLAGFIPTPEGTLFSGFFRTSGLIVLEKNILNFGLLLISLTAYRYLSNIKNQIEFYILMLSCFLGMQVMISSGHILMLYLGLEMSSIPVAALANYNRSQRNSSEAGIKMILSSAFSSGIMLFGISLLYGAVGNLGFENIAANIQPNALTYLALAFIIGGFGFKMSIVPFHLWTADVYEGSPVPVTSFLSVISKGSVIFIFVTVLYQLFGGMKDAWLYAISILSILSMTIGNLFAMRQDNIKRLLAFSSITQVGFVLVGIAGASQMGVTTAVYFILIYILSNVAAFGVVTSITDAVGSESLKNTYTGLYKSNPFLALVMALALFSLAGIPPTAGFFGKLFLLASGMNSAIYVLLAVAGINLVLSAYNYLRVVKIMFIDKAETDLQPIEKGSPMTIALVVCMVGIIITGFVSSLYPYIDSLVK
jgi:NADH-quinone oxidoreductase subunit N